MVGKHFDIKNNLKNKHTKAQLINLILQIWLVQFRVRNKHLSPVFQDQISFHLFFVFERVRLGCMLKKENSNFNCQKKIPKAMYYDVCLVEKSLFL